MSCVASRFLYFILCLFFFAFSAVAAEHCVKIISLGYVVFILINVHTQQSRIFNSPLLVSRAAEMAKINYKFHVSKALTVHFLFVVNNINACCLFARCDSEAETHKVKTQQWAPQEFLQHFQPNRLCFALPSLPLPLQRLKLSWVSFFVRSFVHLFIQKQLSTRLESTRSSLSQSFQKV